MTQFRGRQVTLTIAEGFVPQFLKQCLRGEDNVHAIRIVVLLGTVLHQFVIFRSHLIVLQLATDTETFIFWWHWHSVTRAAVDEMTLLVG